MKLFEIEKFGRRARSRGAGTQGVCETTRSVLLNMELRAAQDAGGERLIGATVRLRWSDTTCYKGVVDLYDPALKTHQ